MDKRVGPGMGNGFVNYIGLIILLQKENSFHQLVKYLRKL